MSAPEVYGFTEDYLTLNVGSYVRITLTVETDQRFSCVIPTQETQSLSLLSGDEIFTPPTITPIQEDTEWDL